MRRSHCSLGLPSAMHSLACGEGGNWPALSTAFGQEPILKTSRLRGSLPSSETGRKDPLGRLLLEVAWTFSGLPRGGRIQTSCRFFLWPVSPPPLGMQTLWKARGNYRLASAIALALPMGASSPFLSCSSLRGRERLQQGPQPVFFSGSLREPGCLGQKTLCLQDLGQPSSHLPLGQATF